MSKPISTKTFRIKTVTFKSERRNVLIQTSPGVQSPLCAAANVLLLRGDITLPAAAQRAITAPDLVQLLANRVLEQNIPMLETALLEIPALATDGLDANCCFASVTRFGASQAPRIFTALGIPLVHGWVIDPQDTLYAPLLLEYTHEDLVNVHVSNTCSERLKNTAMAFQTATAAQQMTEFGLSQLHNTIQTDDLAVFYRSGNFHVMFHRREDDGLYVLCTEAKYAHTPDVFWEKIASTTQQELVDWRFKVVIPAGGGGTSSSLKTPPRKPVVKRARTIAEGKRQLTDEEHANALLAKRQTDDDKGSAAAAATGHITDEGNDTDATIPEVGVKIIDWIGDPISPPNTPSITTIVNRARRKGVAPPLFYGAVAVVDKETRESVTFRVGDCIELKSGEDYEKDVDTVEHDPSYFGRIIALRDCGPRRPHDKIADTAWFYKQSDLPARAGKIKLGKFELVLTDHIDPNPVGSIIQVVNIFFGSDPHEQEKVGTNNLMWDYFCFRFLNVVAGKISFLTKTQVEECTKARTPPPPPPPPLPPPPSLPQPPSSKPPPSKKAKVAITDDAATTTSRPRSSASSLSRPSSETKLVSEKLPDVDNRIIPLPPTLPPPTTEMNKAIPPTSKAAPITTKEIGKTTTTVSTQRTKIPSVGPPIVVVPPHAPVATDLSHQNGKHTSMTEPAVSRKTPLLSSSKVAHRSISKSTSETETTLRQSSTTTTHDGAVSAMVRNTGKNKTTQSTVKKTNDIPIDHATVLKYVDNHIAQCINNTSRAATSKMEDQLDPRSEMLILKALQSAIEDDV